MLHSTPPIASRVIVARLLAGVTAGYVLVLVFATHYPKPEQFLAAAATKSDKLLHFLAYAMLTMLAGGAVAAAGRWTLTSAALLGLGLMAFAALDEVTQPLFPPRTAELFDWVADCGGLGIGLVAIAIVVRVVSRWRQRQLGVGAR